MAARGHCMCGDVQFTVDAPLRDVVNCHCHRCRQWTGHYWAATAAPTADLDIDDTTGALQWYSPADGVEYGFCTHCGSSLFWRVTTRPDTVSISAGCLDQPTGLTTSAQIWLAEHGDYHPPLPDVIGHDHD
ncbi:MAG: hypothetical protein RL238_3040 [Actinomycetota bacterium]|jgi:hypothetical protein